MVSKKEVENETRTPFLQLNIAFANEIATSKTVYSLRSVQFAM